MPRRAERCLQIAPHSLAIVLDAAGGGRPGGDGAGAGAGPAEELGRHRIGYEIFADFKRENMQHFWDRRATAAVAETFFLGWIDEQVLLVQGKEEHLEVLRQGWARRSLKPPSGFHIKCLDTLFESVAKKVQPKWIGHPPKLLASKAASQATSLLPLAMANMIGRLLFSFSSQGKPEVFRENKNCNQMVVSSAETEAVKCEDGSS
ncbi:hypothetical protein HGM15179_003888 [Zosterops borbonicus]|uniref:Storkhead-box protein 1 n=1 Tax=Zosterops borbonicus TaxID=364589 RepID=A0A8K1GR25_9PASS|nr:hypothetical protein HGM15179_003888 [Zosterops borbonicus]